MQHTVLSPPANQSVTVVSDLHRDTTNTASSILERAGRVLTTRFWKYTETGEKSDHSGYEGIL